MEFHEMVGWLGAITYLSAYFLLVIKKLSAEKHLYHIMNVFAGMCMVYNAAHLSDPPVIVLNSIWGGIALFAVVKLSLKNKAANKLG